MYYLSTNKMLAMRAQAELRKAFRRGATQTDRLLSTPGGQIPDATLWVRPDLDLWAYFGDKPDSRKLLLCWFGVGEPSWQASIEINIPVRRTLYCYGQIVTDSVGDVCLAHKGGLGGGKYTVAPGPFADLIEGFEREAIQDGRNQRDYFVLGSVYKPDALLAQLSDFVHEAQRIRDLRARESEFKSALEAVGGKVRNGRALGSEEYSDEAGGAGAYWIRKQVKFERIHAKIQRALARELRKRQLNVGNRRQKHGLGPDLYVRDKRGVMTRLFEIKVGQGSQSTFTALGQILVYAAGETPPPIGTFVTRGLPRSPQFLTALARQDIRVLRYTIDDRSRIKFQDLDAILT